MVRRSGSSAVIRVNALEGNNITQPHCRLPVLDRLAASGDSRGIGKKKKDSEAEERNGCRAGALRKAVISRTLDTNAANRSFHRPDSQDVT